MVWKRWRVGELGCYQQEVSTRATSQLGSTPLGPWGGGSFSQPAQPGTHSFVLPLKGLSHLCPQHTHLRAWLSAINIYGTDPGYMH